MGQLPAAAARNACTVSKSPETDSVPGRALYLCIYIYIYKDIQEIQVPRQTLQIIGGNTFHYPPILSDIKYIYIYRDTHFLCTPKLNYRREATSRVDLFGIMASPCVKIQNILQHVDLGSDHYAVLLGNTWISQQPCILKLPILQQSIGKRVPNKAM